MFDYDLLFLVIMLNTIHFTYCNSLIRLIVRFFFLNGVYDILTSKLGFEILES